MTLRIGLDFDNTLIDYDEVFVAAARDLIGREFRGGKREVRDELRQMLDGERTWQRLQGQVYGKRIEEARLSAGADAFLRRCRREGARVFVVSHKTQFGHHDSASIDLRVAARSWMTANGFFVADGMGLSPGDVFFESTRHDKLARIAELGCAWFVDDLEEVLGSPAFPPGVQRILFSGASLAAEPGPFFVCATWDDVGEMIFRGRA